jgi:MYXO-CTERM domain-containing protein
MKSFAISASVILLAAGSAMAQLSQYGPTNLERTPSDAAGSYGTRGSADDAIIPFNVAGIESWDALGDSSNTIILLDVAAAVGLPSGSPVSMTGIGWDVTLTGIGTSWQSELRVYFDDAIAPDNSGLFLRPGSAATAPGTGSFSSGGIIDLSDNAIPDILLPNGVLRLDFHESFDDAADVLDGTWDAGVLNIAVTPAPGALALMGLGGLAAARRRRN